MDIIGILFDIGLHLVEAIFEFIWGIIWTIIEYCWLPMLIIAAIWLVCLYIKVSSQGTGKPHEIRFDDGTVIGYKTEPPNFREAYIDNLGMRNSCGSCTYCDNLGSKTPLCTKYGVKYRGCGCLDKTVCDDYKNILFDF